MTDEDVARESIKTHPQAEIIISDLENLVGADWSYSHNGNYININGTGLKPHELMAFCDGVRYANKRVETRLKELLCS